MTYSTWSTQSIRTLPVGLFSAFLLLTLLLSACQPVTAPVETDATAGEDVATAAGEGDLTNVVPIDPLTVEQARPPVRLSIPAIELAAPVEPMGWTVVMEGDVRTTQWVVPSEAAGWHVNSVGAGAAGNLLISGHQAVGAAIFAPLALGEVQPGQQIYLTDGDGLTFVYDVVEISDPIAVVGAGPDDEARAADYVQPTDGATLTLITGWPDFTTTHRVFVRADFVGVVR